MNGYTYHYGMLTVGRYWNAVAVNSDKIWLDLCQNCPKAKAKVQAVFNAYVSCFTREVPTIGAEEIQTQRTVTHVKRFDTVWRFLVAEADRTILREKRIAEPSQQNLRRSKWVDHTEHRKAGPV